MTDDLKVLAEAALKVARDDLTGKGAVTPMFMVRTPEGTLEIMRFDGKSGNLFNSGAAKDLLFDAMRQIVAEKGITAVVFATEAWIGKATEKGLALGEKEFHRKTRERAFETAVSEGLVERREAIVVNVQTAEGVLMVQQFFVRDYTTESITYAERLDAEVGANDFFGRQKMYGDLRPENLS
jgi:hypothetical protein